VSDAAGTVSIVWNDASRNPLGDIVLQSYHLGTLSPVQGAPVKLNSDLRHRHLAFFARGAERGR
jgi:hypothetical protein